MNSGISWIVAWCNEINFLRGLPEWVYALLSLICIYCFVVVPCAAILSYLDRKLSADLQARVGPNQAGPIGILQPLADIFKLLQKETPSAFRWDEGIWFSVYTMALYSTLAVMPLGSLALMVDTEMSAFLPFWSVLVLALGTMLLGLGQESVPGWFGGIHVAAQTLAGAFPALIALLCAGVRAGGFRWSVLAESQGFAPWSWAVLSNPFQTIAFIVFVVSGLILLAIPPLDSGLSMSDFEGGVASQLHGRRLSLYRFSRFYVFFLWSIITVVLFLGAWVLPEQALEILKQAQADRVLSFIELVWLLIKTFILMLLIVWVSRVNPKSRVDQTTDLSWKVLSPFSLVALVGASLWAGWRAFL